MRVLILGGTRFIGWHIASTPKRGGHRVAVFHRGSTPLKELSGIEEILGDKTKLVARSRFPSVEDLEGALAMGMIGGALVTYDRLAAEIAKG